MFRRCLLLKVMCFTFVASLLLTPNLQAAEIVYWDSDYVFAKARLVNSVQQNSYQLIRGNRYGNLASVKANNNSLAESYSSLSFSRNGANSTIEINTFANTGRVYSSAFAEAYTTSPLTTSGFQYVYFYVRPTSSGEYNGKPTTLDLTTYASSNILYPDNKAANDYAVYGPAGLMMQRRDYRTTTNSASQRVNTTMGTWNAIAIRGLSDSTVKTSAQLLVKINVTAR